MAAIMYIDEKGDLSQFCGGAIISDKYVLTAAHCVYPQDETYVRLGDHDYEKEGETKHVVTIEVVKQIGHKGYNEDTTDKDIGLMYLKESIKFGKYDGTIVPVCLPTEHLKYYSLTATVAGWGMYVNFCFFHIFSGG
jgi:secreted trypsin-like serine protease